MAPKGAVGSLFTEWYPGKVETKTRSSNSWWNFDPHQPDESSRVEATLTFRTSTQRCLRATEAVRWKSVCRLSPVLGGVVSHVFGAPTWWGCPFQCSFTHLRHPTCPFFRYEKKHARITDFCSTPQKTLAPRKNARPHPLLPSRGRRDCYVFLNLHLFADICARFADVCARFALRFLLAPFEYSATDHLGGPTSPVLGKAREAGKSVRLPYFGDDPWFCNTFGLRAEIYVTKGAPGRKLGVANVQTPSFWKEGSLLLSNQGPYLGRQYVSRTELSFGYFQHHL